MSREINPETDNAVAIHLVLVFTDDEAEKFQELLDKLNESGLVVEMDMDAIGIATGEKNAK